MKQNKNKKEDEIFELLGELINDLEEYEREIKLLEKKGNKTEQEKKDLIRYKKEHKLIKESVNKGNYYFLEQVGGPMSLYYLVKKLAEQGNKQAKEDLENMTPFIHKYMSEENINKN